jgi:hypothetical protein
MRRAYTTGVLLKVPMSLAKVAMLTLKSAEARSLFLVVMRNLSRWEE